MKPRVWFFALASSLLAACGEVLVLDGGHTSPDGTTTTSSSSTSTGTSSGTGGQGGQGTGGADAGPLPDCPAQIAPPADCGEYADACAGALPIAGGGDTTRAKGVALDATFAYWFASAPVFGGCGGVIYRTPRTGGPATRFADAPDPNGFEVDATALYVLTRVAGAWEVRAFDTSTGSATALGPIAPPSDTVYKLANTPAGVVAFSWSSWAPSFFRVGSTGITAIATDVGPSGYLGSEPSFDGASLFFSLSPLNAWKEVSTLVGVAAGSATTIELGVDATTRQWPSVVASGADVFFVTGDPSVAFGEVPHPMGISRVAKTGGAPTILLPSGAKSIDQLLVDATDVYFSVRPLLPGGGPPYSIQSVPRAGGPVRTVWSSTAHPDSLRQDAGALYFALALGKEEPIPDGTGLGPGGFIVRVEKTASVP